MLNDPGLRSRYATAVLALIFLLVIGGVSWWHRSSSRTAEAPISQEQIQDSPDDIAEDEVSLEGKTSLLAGSKTGWEIYRCEGQGYELRYPEGWMVIEAKPKEGTQAVEESLALFGGEMQKATFQEPGGKKWPGEFQVRVIQSHGFDLEQWLKDNEPADVLGGSLVQSTVDMALDGVPAKRLSIFAFDHEEMQIVALHEGRICSLDFAGHNPNDPDGERHRQIHEQMLSSFHFTR